MNTTINDFLAYMQASKGALPNTIATYRESLDAAVDFFRYQKGADVLWTALETDDFRAWEAEQMERGYSPAYVKRNMAALRSLYRFLLREGRIKIDPVRLVKNPKQQKRLPTFVRESEMDRLFEHYDFGTDYLGVRNRTIMLLLYHTGIRSAELCGLGVNDIDLPGNSLRVTGKGDKQRIVPFGPELHDAFEAYLTARREHVDAASARRASQSAERTPPHALFLTRRCAPLRYAELRTVVTEALRTVTTQKKKSPHVLRHSFATAMLAHGAQIEAIQQLLGHVTVATTAIYTHTTLAELKDQYAAAHPRNEK